MATIVPSTDIEGVKLVELKEFADSRGRFLETFRREWFPERSWEVIQTNRSDSNKNVLRGLHYHFHQIDYWYLVHGSIRVGLYDLRKASPTHGNGFTFEMTPKDGLFIPVGVAHGFVALKDSTLTYIVDNYYDDSDEHGVAWNDPQIGLDWGVTDPILSPRDEKNPWLKDLEHRP